MKKLVFAFIAVVALSMSACGNSTANGGANDSDSIAVDTLDTTVVDTVVADTIVAE